MKIALSALTTLLVAQTVYAEAYNAINTNVSSQSMSMGQDRGGGDPCEDRIKIIRDDIKSWILKGGSASLRLPQGLSSGQYAQAMLQQISSAHISCVGSGDRGYPVMIGQTPKICRFDKTTDESVITCDFRKFKSIDESEQYLLIHHEYAGLANIERPNGADSNYEVSNQISAFLENFVIKKLVVKPKPDPNGYERILAYNSACEESGLAFENSITTCFYSKVSLEQIRACSYSESGMVFDDSILSCIQSKASLELIKACSYEESGLVSDSAILSCIQSKAPPEHVRACTNPQSGPIPSDEKLKCILDFKLN